MKQSKRRSVQVQGGAEEEWDTVNYIVVVSINAGIKLKLKVYLCHYISWSEALLAQYRASAKQM